MAKRTSFEDEMAALSEVAESPRSDDGRTRLLAGLRSKRSLVVARAARLVKQHGLDGLDAELKEAFFRFLENPVKNDPSCHAKLAAIEALDYAESMDAAPFLRAVRHSQFEPVDTAAGVRSRGVLALARIGHSDFDLVAARLLTDPLSPVRQAALDALVHRGDRAGAALALGTLCRGDEDPLVTLAAMSALLTLAPGPGLDEVRERLDGEDRELAAVALGQSRSDDALAALLDALERCTRPEERQPILRGVGLHRSERALEALLVVIADRSEADARSAIESLGPRRFEAGIVERVRAAAARNSRADLSAIVEETFSPPA
jgi:hypothetical protein